MPKMSLLWVAIYVMCLVGSFISPLYGIVGYLFEYYLRPALHWWGSSLPELRWNLMIAAVLTVTYLLRRSSLPDIGPARRAPATCLLALLLVMLLVLPIAADQKLSWEKTVAYSKMILFHGLVVGTVRSELAFDTFVAAHMAGAGWWGWEVYRKPKRSAGRLMNVGSGDTQGDNAASAHLLTVIPFIAVYLTAHKDKRLRALAFLVAPFVLNTFILCNSRGAFVGMVVAAVAAIWLAKGGHRFRMIAVGAGLAAALYVLADPEFLSRQQTITKYEDDGSAMDRLGSWSAGLRLIGDHPFGTGGQGFWELSPIYAADIVAANREKRDPHNTYILVASEWGIFGLVLFLGYYVSSFRLLTEVQRQSKGGIWYYRSLAIQVSMIGLLVAGVFVDRLYAEAPYWMGALAVSLHRLHSHKLQQESNVAPAPPQSVGSRTNERVRLRRAV